MSLFVYNEETGLEQIAGKTAQNVDGDLSTTSQNPIENQKISKSLSDQFDSAKSYAKGDIVIYDGNLRQANTDISSGDFIESQWDFVSLSDAVKQINSNLSQLKSDLTDITWPIGSVYTSTEPTSPEILFGGTWERITSRYLYAISDSESTGAGGRSSFDITPGGTVNGTAITKNQLPKLTGSFFITDNVAVNTADSPTIYPDGGVFSGKNRTNNQVIASQTTIVSGTANRQINFNAGNNEAHSHGFTGAKQTINLDPSRYGVYAWRRTA